MPFPGSPGFEFDRAAYDRRLLKLAKFRHVPDDLLTELVTRDGLAFWVFDLDEMPQSFDDEDVDRALAAYLCDGCPVIDECLELEFRTAGADTVGVWGGLSETDRRALYPIWRAQRDQAENDDREGGESA